MTEQEIIKRLKENKKMGTPFYFLPEDVRDYLLKHKDEEKTFLVFNTAMNEWGLNPNGISCIDELIYALPDDYKPKKPFKPRWEEFEINSEGKFMIPHESMDCVACLYPYWNWNGFLSDNNDKYNAFGGWLYMASKERVWSTFPLFEDELGYTRSASTESEDVKMLIPTKIRFWRFRE